MALLGLICDSSDFNKSVNMLLNIILEISHNSPQAIASIFDTEYDFIWSDLAKKYVLETSIFLNKVFDEVDWSVNKPHEGYVGFVLNIETYYNILNLLEKMVLQNMEFKKAGKYEHTFEFKCFKTLKGTLCHNFEKES